MTISSILRGLALVGAAVLAGCASPLEGTSSGAVNTGTYPNLNVAPAVAAPQFTPYTLGQHNARLAAAQQDQATQTAEASVTLGQSAADAARLKQLRAAHSESTLNEIESGVAVTPAQPAAN